MILPPVATLAPLTDGSNCWVLPLHQHYTLHMLPACATNANYIYILENTLHNSAIIIDPGEAAPVLNFLQERPMQVDALAITHRHWDHVNGIATLVQKLTTEVIANQADTAIPHVSRPIAAPGNMQWWDLSVELLHVPGHLEQHIAYYIPALSIIFCGDTLFSLGCGRIFEGTPAQLYASLMQLSNLPEHTLVACAHEYTQQNCLFARSVLPDDTTLADYEQHITALRSRNVPSVPSLIGLERQLNPFLRCHDPALRHALGQDADRHHTNDVAVFTALRSRKDAF